MIITKLRSSRSSINNLRRLLPEQPTRPFNLEFMITAKTRDTLAGAVCCHHYVKCLMCPNILYSISSTRSDRGLVRHLSYGILFDITLVGHLMFMILRRCFLCVMSSLLSIEPLAAQLLAL